MSERVHSRATWILPALAIVMLVFFCARLAAAAKPMCGDVSGDGAVDMTDVMLIARGEIFTGTPEAALCDVNQDGICNVVDALMIARGEYKPNKCARVKGKEPA